MRLSKKAVTVLRRCFRTDDSSIVLSRMWAKGSQELKDNGLAEFIPRSQGGAIVALTAAGITEAEARQLGMD